MKWMGGAGGRSLTTSAGVMSHACTWPKFGSIGPGWRLLADPGNLAPRRRAVGQGLPLAGVADGAPHAVGAARAISTVATALPNASPPRYRSPPPCRPQGGVALLRGSLADLRHGRGKQDLQHLDRHARQDRVLEG